MYALSRPEFHGMLLAQLEACGIRVQYGRKVVGYYEDVEMGMGGVVLEGGERVEGDVVVAADGVQTRSWRVVRGEEVMVRSSGNAILRAAFDVEVAMGDEMVGERWPPVREDGVAEVELWVGWVSFSSLLKVFLAGC